MLTNCTFHSTCTTECQVALMFLPLPPLVLSPPVTATIVTAATLVTQSPCHLHSGTSNTTYVCRYELCMHALQSVPDHPGAVTMSTAATTLTNRVANSTTTTTATAVTLVVHIVYAVRYLHIKSHLGTTWPIPED